MIMIWSPVVLTVRKASLTSKTRRITIVSFFRVEGEGAGRKVECTLLLDLPFNNVEAAVMSTSMVIGVVLLWRGVRKDRWEKGTREMRETWVTWERGEKERSESPISELICQRNIHIIPKLRTKGKHSNHLCANLRLNRESTGRGWGVNWNGNLRPGRTKIGNIAVKRKRKGLVMHEGLEPRSYVYVHEESLCIFR